MSFTAAFLINNSCQLHLCVQVAKYNVRVHFPTHEGFHARLLMTCCDVIAAPPCRCAVCAGAPPAPRPRRLP